MNNVAKKYWRNADNQVASFLMRLERTVTNDAELARLANEVRSDLQAVLLISTTSLRAYRARDKKVRLPLFVHPSDTAGLLQESLRMGRIKGEYYRFLYRFLIALDNPIKYPALTRKLIREAVPFLPILGAKIRQIPAPKTRMIYDVVNDIKGMRVIVYYQTLPSQKRKK